VNVVGQQGVGKTTLVKRLQGFSPTCPDKIIHPTEALDVMENTCHCIEQLGNRIWETNIEGNTLLLFIYYDRISLGFCFT